MPKPIHRVTTIVRSIERVCDGVLAFDLADPDDWELPAWTAGAHIDVHTPSGAVRQYSLCGDPAERRRYRIAVRREREGRGGSESLHADVAVGTALLVSLPRNHFPLRPGARHVMIAGGIGITPFLSMIPVLRREGVPFTLHYAARDADSAPFLAALEPLAHEGRLHRWLSRAPGGRRIDLAAVLAAAGEGTQVHCCGPAAMVEDVLRLGEGLGDRLHVELFDAPAASGDPDYVVELARSGRTVAVPRGTTMLAALREAGVEVQASCEGGVCLECATRYLAGSPLHRDLTMPAADRARLLTPCVSGCLGGRLVLDL